MLALFNTVVGKAGGPFALRQRYNLLTYSEQFDNAVWTKDGGSFTSTTEVSPSGTATADYFTENTANSIHGPSWSWNITSGTTYVFSCFIKPISGESRLEFVLPFGTNYLWFILDTADRSLVATRYNNGSYTFTTDANGWSRFVGTCAANATNTYTARMSIAHGTSTNSVWIGTSSVMGFWGAQLATAADYAAIGGRYQRITDANGWATTGYPL